MSEIRLLLGKYRQSNLSLSEEDVVTYGNTQCDQFLHSLEQSAIDAERVLGE